MGWNKGKCPPAAIYGEMSITQSDTVDTNPTNTIVVVAHPSGTDVLNPPAPQAATGGPYGGYYLIPNFIQSNANSGVTISGGSIVIPFNGDYIISSWGGFRHSQNNATVAFIMCAERSGIAVFSQNPAAARKPNLDKLGHLTSSGTIPLLAGDILSPCIASDTSGTITLGNAVVTIQKL